VVQLVIGARSILALTLLNNASLTRIFNQLQSLELIGKFISLPWNYALQLAKPFSSLIHIEVECLLLDMCRPFLNALLCNSPKLCHVKINFSINITFNDLLLTCYVIENRRQAFPFKICNGQDIFVKINNKTLDIYLDGCTICAKKLY
jgi:hypothetical protein